MKQEINRLELFLDYSNKVIKEFEGKGTENVSLDYLIENSLRSYDILLSVSILLKSNLGLSELEHPLGILFRSGLYDFIYLQYVMNKSLKNNILDSESLDSEIREYINGHFNKVGKDFELIDSLKGKDRFKDFKSKDRFKELGVLKEGRSFAESKKLPHLKLAIDCWEWYSKYEHYGVFTNLMYNDIEGNRIRVQRSIELLSYNICFSLHLLLELGYDKIKLEDIKKLEDISLDSINNYC